MLTKRQNLMETIRGGNPDRFVNQYEFLDIIMEAPLRSRPQRGQTITNEWGITLSWPEDQLGPFPVHDEAHLAIKDITQWREVIQCPTVEFPDERWAPAIEHANAVDRADKFVTVFFASGTFEMTHFLLGMENAMV